MVLGVLIGLAVLILVVLLLIAFGFRRRRKRAVYARRKALSDQATTETTSSNTSKQLTVTQTITQHPSVTASSYVYLRQQPTPGSDSGAGGVASTYMSHAAFAATAATDGCWPAGLQPPPTGANYFDDQQSPMAAFPALGRDSSSQGYVQLPVRCLAVAIK